MDEGEREREMTNGMERTTEGGTGAAGEREWSFDFFCPFIMVEKRGQSKRSLLDWSSELHNLITMLLC